MKPIFKWMGGKRRMMPVYEEQLNLNYTEIENFYDLFAGSLASSIWAYEKMPNANIHMNEINPFLVGLYNCIKNDLQGFITELYKNVDEFLQIPVEKELDKKGHRHLRKRYDWYRTSLIELNLMWHGGLHQTSPAKFYALQYLLQRVSFGGAWQTNKQLSPTYATPSGSLTATSRSLYNAVELTVFSEFLNDPRVIITNKNYLDVDIVPGNTSLVFADPPYLFTVQKYDAPFGVHDQKNLCTMMELWHWKGNKVMMTNSPWDQWEVHLPSFKIWSKPHTYTTGQKSLDSFELLIANCLK